MRILFLDMQYSAFSFLSNIKAFMADEAGQDLVEYAVLCALVAAGVVAASSNFATIISGAFSTMAGSANNAINNA